MGRGDEGRDAVPASEIPSELASDARPQAFAAYLALPQQPSGAQIDGLRPVLIPTLRRITEHDVTLILYKAAYLREHNAHAENDLGYCATCKASSQEKYQDLDRFFHPAPFLYEAPLTDNSDEDLSLRAEDWDGTEGSEWYVKWLLDGATDIHTIAKRLRELSRQMENMAQEGWYLRESVDDGHFTLSHDDPGKWDLAEIVEPEDDSR